MPDKQKLHAFALKWLEKFNDQNINYIELVDHFLADDCKELGFEMDCGNAFEEQYGNAVYDSDALKKVLVSISNAILLGSAIYSRWRYFNHWAYSGAEILEPKNREWFITALSRLVELSASNNKPDVVNRIAIDYHRVTKIKPGVLPEGATWEYATWDYSEQLILDRESETIEHIQNIGSGCVVSRKYMVQDGVADFLDDLDADSLFANIEGNPDDVIETPLETKDYTIIVDFKRAPRRVIEGTFDKHGLPDDWAEFAEDIWAFMMFYGFGEILNPHVFSKDKRRMSDYIFCSVSFEADGRTYYYLTDNDEMEVDDLVVVPAGKDNHEVIARVEEIEHFSEDNAPFPIEKTKKIIRKHLKTEDKLTEDEESLVLPDGAVIMGGEPLPGMSADKWRDMFDDNCTDADLATALAGAWNKSGWLGHDLDDENCIPEIEAAYKEWFALEEELVQKIALRMNRKCETPYIKLITPFMEQNGYRDGSGWWVKG